MSERRSILLLCDDSRGHAGNVLQHIAALSELSRHDVHLFNPVDRPESARLLDLEEFDVVVIHYTIMITGGRYLSAELAEKIARFHGLKVQSWRRFQTRHAPDFETTPDSSREGPQTP